MRVEVWCDKLVPEGIVDCLDAEATIIATLPLAEFNDVTTLEKLAIVVLSPRDFLNWMRFHEKLHGCVGTC